MEHLPDPWMDWVSDPDQAQEDFGPETPILGDYSTQRRKPSPERLLFKKLMKYHADHPTPFFCPVSGLRGEGRLSEDEFRRHLSWCSYCRRGLPWN